MKRLLALLLCLSTLLALAACGNSNNSANTSPVPSDSAPQQSDSSGGDYDVSTLEGWGAKIKSEADGKGRCHTQLLLSLILRPAYQQRCAPGYKRSQKKKRHILYAGAHIKIIAGYQQDAPPVPPRRQPVNCKYNWQKYVKRIGIKQHSAVPLRSS